MPRERESIQSEDLSVGNLFKHFYQVPVYQREYVWGEKQVQQLVEDIVGRLDDAGYDSEYFIGSIVTSEIDSALHELIDGQQRVTTLYLILCATRDYLQGIGHEPPRELQDQISYPYADERTCEELLRYRVVLNYSGGQGLLELLGGGADAETLDSFPRRAQSTQNLIDAYELAKSYLKSAYNSDETRVKRFWMYITKRVKLIRVSTGSLTDALAVFETINDRGIGLDDMDLLKNLLFMNASDQEYESLRVKWETLSERLYKREKALRFLRYFIFSSFDSGMIKADEAYEWLKTHADDPTVRISENPVGLVDRLLEVSEVYVNLLEGRNPSGSENRYLRNLQALAGSARQHLILLLAGRRLPLAAFELLCKEVEDLFFVFIVTRTPKNEFEDRFVRWAAAIRAITTEDDLRRFVAREVSPFKAAKASAFDFSLRQLADAALPKYRRKYLLAKLAQKVNEDAYQGSGWQDLGKLMDRAYEIEHILPVNPRDDIVQTFDKPEEIGAYTHRLGNLTLVEKPINAAIGNSAFELKRPAYRESQVLLTRAIAGVESVGTNTSINRAVRALSPFAQWRSSSILRREEELLSLAHEVWGLPHYEIPPDAEVAF